MCVKNDYCVQVKTKKMWRYYTNKYGPLQIALEKMSEAKKKYHTVRMLNKTEFGIRVSDIR